MKSELVAVYGSLRRSLHNHPLLSSSELVGSSVIRGYSMYSAGGFPVVYYNDSPTPITIEVYKVDNEGVMSRLDSLEGHPNWYRRERVHTPEGEAWMYIMQDEGYKRNKHIVDGDWLEHVRQTTGANLCAG